MENLEEQVRKIIAKQLDLNEDQVVPQAKFIEDLRADSLDIVEMVMAFEDKFEIEIPEEDSEKIATVSDVYDYLRARLSS